MCTPVTCSATILSPPCCLQVRCMAAVLQMVGRGEEEPEIVATLLDVGRTPCKPQYNMASGECVRACVRCGEACLEVYVCG